MLNETINGLIQSVARTLGVGTFDVVALTSITLVCLACGLVGSLVIGNRMAFFSDAMAHTAFAGIALGLLSILFLARPRSTQEADPYLWVIPLIMIGVGVAAGFAIEFVRERTGLSNDTVIGVFFAAAIGFAVTVIGSMKNRVANAEQFLFGSPLYVTPIELLLLAVLVLLTAIIIVWKYNDFAFGVISPPLARSRGVRLRFGNYLFIAILALVVNISIKAVGVLLINAVLIVPAAAAANLARNVRELFLYTLVIGLLSGWIGYQISKSYTIDLGEGDPLELAPGGTIVLTCVAFFFASIVLAAVRRRFGFDRPRTHVHTHAGDAAGCCDH